jgi:hypothetical protein
MLNKLKKTTILCPLCFEKNNFSPNDAAAGWNGTFKGATQPIETYTWIFEGVDYNGVIIRDTGKSTLIR